MIKTPWGHLFLVAMSQAAFQSTDLHVILTGCPAAQQSGNLDPMLCEFHHKINHQLTINNP